MKEIIKNVGSELKKIVNYRFLRWKGNAKYPYFVGELYGDGSGDESGETGYSFLLTGFYRGEDEISLYDAAERIMKRFPADTGSLILCRDGGMLVSVQSMDGDIPDTDEELVRLQITLQVKRWKGKK
ncbi:MAG: hypothetical protein NC305_13310 [Lachnospiraceae bacterium]|nr:hypothetical protein [Butyrivibrio sp.]MCM1344024.1 hypothetical protein [Muribaculaceae bacterium]MCM1411509.1 hypothetical protein [Lachnospiraceae bacterium]